MKVSAIPFLAVALTLVACGDPGPATAPGPASEPVAPAPTVSPQATAPAPSTLIVPVPDATTTAPVPATTGRLAIEGEGLRIFDAASGAARPISFGVDRAVIDTALTRVLGAARNEGVNAECGGAAFVDWPTGLRTWSSNGKFVGWSLSDRVGQGGPKTAAGQGIGTTRAEFEAASVMEVRQSSLGVEFTSWDIAGLLTSMRPEGRVSALWAGQTCIAR